MAHHGAVIFEDQVRIPLGMGSLDRFRRWARSGEFPEQGRIDYLNGEIEVDMSPEDLLTHGIVKSAIAGYGAADKEQVQRMVQLVLAMTERPRPDDAADALAIAVCHAHHRQSAARRVAAMAVAGGRR